MDTDTHENKKNLLINLELSNEHICNWYSFKSSPS